MAPTFKQKMKRKARKLKAAIRIKEGLPQTDKKEINRWRAKGRNFYMSETWIRLRYDALVASNGSCGCCGRSARYDGVVLQVDHIKPISLFPALRADPSNLQIICSACNWGKGARDQTDWRTGPIIPMNADGRSAPPHVERER